MKINIENKINESRETNNLLTKEKILSDSEAEEMNKIIKKMRKEKGFRKN